MIHTATPCKATAAPDDSSLSLHDALPISITDRKRAVSGWRGFVSTSWAGPCSRITPPLRKATRSATSSRDRKSTRLNSSHGYISYAVFCLKKKNKDHTCHID